MRKDTAKGIELRWRKDIDIEKEGKEGKGSVMRGEYRGKKFELAEEGE